MPIDWATSMNNLALAYANRIRGDHAQNIEDAISAYNQALEIFHPDQLPDYCRNTARLLGNLCADNQHWPTAVVAYQPALKATENLYQTSLFLSSQAAELSEANDLFRRTAFAQAQAENLAAAVVTLERGRARGLRDALERDRSDLAQVETMAPDLYQEYQSVVEALRQLETDERSIGVSDSTHQTPLSQDELCQRATTIRDQFRKAIERIRQLPGYIDFLAQSDIEDIVAVIQPNQPLVYLVTTPNGSLALITQMPSSKGNGEIAAAAQIYPIWLYDLTETSLLDLLQGPGEELGGWFGAYANRQTDRNAWFNTIDQVTYKLWDLLMGPVVTQLTDLGVAQAVLSPTGYLGFLPLHAAWTENDTTPTGRRYAMDRIHLHIYPQCPLSQSCSGYCQAHPHPFSPCH